MNISFEQGAVHRLVASQYKIAPDKLMRTGINPGMGESTNTQIQIHKYIGHDDEELFSCLISPVNCYVAPGSNLVLPHSNNRYAVKPVN